MTAGIVPFKPPAKRLTAQDVAERCEGYRQHGDYWQAKCPAHDDKVASLTISTGEDGRVLLHCHANCEPAAILDKLKLTFADLMPARSANGKRKIVKVYDYADEEGKLRYQVVRYDPKDFVQRRPDGNGGYFWNMKDTEPLPYRLPELIAASIAGRTVYIVEGEKDADNLTRIAVAATSNHGGAGKWNAALNVYFIDADVAIIPDNDDPGRKHADQVAAHLHGIAKRVRVLGLPNLPPKGDVSDWIAAGGTADELKTLTDRALDWTPSALKVEQAVPDAVAKPAACAPPFVKADLLNDLPPIGWIIPELMPVETVGMLYAPTNTGKSYLALKFAFEVAQQCPVLYVATEGLAGLQSRRKALCQFHGMTSGELYFWAVQTPEGKTTLPPAPNLFTGERLEGIIAFAGQVRAKLIIFDPLADCALGWNENDNGQAAYIKANCRRIVAETGATVYLVHHSGKAGSGYRGASALEAAVDFSHELKVEDDLLIVECPKMRDAPKFEPRAFRRVNVQLSTGSDDVLLPSGRVIQTQADKLTPLQRQLLETLILPTFDQGAKVGDLAKVIPEVKPKEMYRALAKLIDLKFVQKDGRFDPYAITIDGRGKVSQLQKSHRDKVSQVSQ